LQLQSQQQLEGGVKIPASVPFLYKQYKSATTIGKPQPLKTPEQKNPSFEPSTISAIRIQRVVLPDKQQFIETSCVSPQGYVDCILNGKILRFLFFLLHNIQKGDNLCKRQDEKE
jgi:hypothetical protein